MCIQKFNVLYLFSTVNFFRVLPFLIIQLNSHSKYIYILTLRLQRKQQYFNVPSTDRCIAQKRQRTQKITINILTNAVYIRKTYYNLSVLYTMENSTYGPK